MPCAAMRTGIDAGPWKGPSLSRDSATIARQLTWIGHRLGYVWSIRSPDWLDGENSLPGCPIFSAPCLAKDWWREKVEASEGREGLCPFGGTVHGRGGHRGTLCDLCLSIIYYLFYRCSGLWVQRLGTTVAAANRRPLFYGTSTTNMPCHQNTSCGVTSVQVNRQIFPVRSILTRPSGNISLQPFLPSHPLAAEKSY